MEDFKNLINWHNLHKNSELFKKNKPFRFVFVEDFFVREFYEKLYETYPTINSTWKIFSDLSKFQYYLPILDNTHEVKQKINPSDEKVTSLSEEWKKLLRYSVTDEFVDHFRRFSGVDVNKYKYFEFMAYQKGGFQLPHIHNVGPSTLILMLYFSKGWKKGDPGGTYMASGLDEKAIIFEPYNLDNTLAIFHDGPHAAHGVRYIVKDVIRQGLQITLENFSDSRWSGEKKSTINN